MQLKWKIVAKKIEIQISKKDILNILDLPNFNEWKMSNVYDYMFHVLMNGKSSSTTLFFFANKAEKQYM